MRRRFWNRAQESVVRGGYEMLIQAPQAALLVIDIQQRLMPAIFNAEQVLNNSVWLLQIAKRLEIPYLVTEQYPQGLGGSVPELAQAVVPQQVVQKVHFSCAAEPECLARIQALGRRQLVLTGSEAHVCVLQSALGLLQQGFEVFLVADAVGSRRESDYQLALQRMRHAGVQIVSCEMVAFEWLHCAGNDRFRAISREFIR